MMQMDRQGTRIRAGKPSAHGPGTFRDDWRVALRGPGIVVLLLATGAGAWGVVDGLRDADGERIWGMMPVVAPAIFSVWCAVETLWQPPSALLRRIVFSCLIAPVAALSLIVVVKVIVAMLPGSAETIRLAGEANNGFHFYYEGEGLWSTVFLTVFAGYGIAAFAALMTVMVVVLPVWSLRAPDAVAKGSHLDKVPLRQRFTAVSLLFCGLGVFTLGVMLWVFGGDGRGIDEVPRVLGSSYGPDLGDLSFLAGVVLVVLGIGGMCWPLLRVLFARRQSRSGQVSAGAQDGRQDSGSSS